MPSLNSNVLDNVGQWSKTVSFILGTVKKMINSTTNAFSFHLVTLEIPVLMDVALVKWIVI